MCRRKLIILWRLLALLAVAGGLSAPGPAQAIVLDWDALTWTPGSLANTYDIDPNNPGVDVIILVTGDTSRFQAGSPAITSNLTGGLVPAETSLQLAVDFSNGDHAVTVTIRFFYTLGVDEVTYDLFDIDRDGTSYIDQVRSLSGELAGGSAVAPTITGSPNNTVTGTGVNQVITGTGTTADNSGLANADISFGTNAVHFVTFTFGSDGTVGNPTPSSISLHDISFRPRPIPEVGSIWGALGICVGAVTVRNFRSRRLAS